jgi:peptide/nickel transport system substrate-binding protein
MSNKTIIASLVCGLMLSTSAVSAADIKQGGTLTVPIINTGFVDNYNPYTTGGLFDGILFEPLMIFNTMTSEVDYRLAESVEYSDDLKTITLKLRQGLQWSDGEVLDAEDVVYSYNITKDVAAFDVKAVWSTGNLQTVTATDAQTIVFKLDQPDSTFVWGLTKYPVVPQHIWSKISATDLPTFTNPNPVGSGPLTDVKFLKPQQMQLCRNPHYYLENRPYIDCMTFRSYNDNSQIQPALMKGEIDWGSNFIADVENTYVKANPEHHHFWYPANDAIHLYVNTKEKPFDDIRVRQALSMALDREEIVDIAAYGYPTVNHNAGGIAELYAPFIDKKITEKYKYLTEFNPEKSQQLLDEAGFVDTDGDGFRNIPQGDNIEFNIDVVNGWTDWIQVVQMVSEYYEEIGIKANVKTVDWSVYDSAMKDGGYKMAINWSMVASNPIEAYQTYFLTSQVGKIWHAGHGVNSPEIDALINSFGLTNDAEEQQKILNQLQEFTAQNLPFIPLFSNPTWFQYSTEKFVGWPSQENPYVQPSFYDGGNRNLIINQLHLK